MIKISLEVYLTLSTQERFKLEQKLDGNPSKLNLCFEEED